MIFKECMPKNIRQTAEDATRLIRYASRTHEPIEDVEDDQELDAIQLLIYAAESKEASESIYITSNELESADEMIFKPKAINENWDDVIDEFIDANNRNPRCEKPLKHFVLSLPEEDLLSEDDWAKATEYFMQKLGYKNTRWISFLHNKKSNPHVHIIASRIDLMTNNVVPEWQEHTRAFEIVRQIEKDFNLTRLASPGDDMKPVKQPDGSYEMVQNNSQELSDKKRMPHKNDIVRRLNAIHENLFNEDYKPSLSEWMLALREAGVGVQMSFTEAGKVKGITYRIKTEEGGPNFICSASKLGGSGRFGFKKMQQRLTKITVAQLNAAKGLSERETRMRDGLEADVIAFTKIKDIKLLAQVAFDVQAMMDEQFFAKRMRKPNRKNFKVHRRDGRYCVSQRIKMTALRRLGKMTKPEYEAMINRKFAECLIEMIGEFFGWNEPDPLRTKEMYDNGELMHALSPDESYIQLHGINLNNEVITESQHEVIELPKNIPQKPKKSDSTSPAKTVTYDFDYSPSL
ncbi:relaxase/mobilization nuclease domain-containing protein [Vibrio sp. BS-M-Sm-2]|uniref:relaxase/mobilization nuclease domain-containing protein n=2 Tax=Vibrio sp. BS-M-Sm-2 TaxID=3241167 RepID=UPI00390C91F1